MKFIKISPPIYSTIPHSKHTNQVNIFPPCLERSGKRYFAAEANANLYFKYRGTDNIKKLKSYDAVKTPLRPPLAIKLKAKENDSSFDDLDQLVKNYKAKGLKKMTLRTTTTRLTCFARRGNHTRRDTLFRKYRINRVFNSKVSEKLPLSFYLPAFFHAATPFVRLKTRRRRGPRRNKKVARKVTFRLRSTGERRSYLLFSKRLQKYKKTSKSGSFRDQIQLQRESLFMKNRSIGLKTNKQRATQIKTGSLSSSNDLWEVRDDIHKLAYKAKPRLWGRFKRLKIPRERRERFERRRQERYTERFLRYHTKEIVLYDSREWLA